MKIRKGFVSNSSSSSFMCDITGEINSERDASLSDFDMIECEHGHQFLYEGYPEVEEFVNGEAELTEAEEADEEREENELPARLCPICNGQAKALIVERLKHELKRLNITAKDLK